MEEMTPETQPKDLVEGFDVVFVASAILFRPTYHKASRFSIKIKFRSIQNKSDLVDVRGGLCVKKMAEKVNFLDFQSSFFQFGLLELLPVFLFQKVWTR